MNSPTEANLKHTVYRDDVIAVGLLAAGEGDSTQSMHLAVKWLPPKPHRKQGVDVEVTNPMGGETDWFIIPHTLSVGMARMLIERRVANLDGFDETGFGVMVSWLLELGDLFDGMCY